MTGAAHALILERFRWVEGHADIWRVFADPAALAAVVTELAAPWQDAGVTHVVGIESRGFLLGGAVAVSLGAGFVAIRKDGTGLLPGPKVSTTAAEDYRGNQHVLRMQAVLTGRDRVLLVDDWAERGSQALAARELVARCGASFLGCSLMVDMLPASVRPRLGTVTAVVQAAELGPSS
jgi:adenine phosphoribosyltransferase